MFFNRGCNNIIKIKNMSFKEFKTERILLVSIVVLSLVVFVNAFSKEMGTNVSLAGENSEASGSSNKEGSSDEGSEEEASQENEDSQEEPSQDEASVQSSTSSAPVVRKTQTADSIKEASETSLQEVSETSQPSVAGEVSEVSEPSEKSQDISEESMKYVEGYGDVVAREGNVVLVKKDEKLFFLAPVEVQSQVTLDEQGNVTDVKKSFLNWFLSVFSF